MHAILNFAQYIVQFALIFIVWTIIVYAVFTWLISFEVINLRNRLMSSIWRMLEGLARPILRPFQRIIPTIGGMDISPIVLFAIVGGTQLYLVPALFSWLHTLVGATSAY